VPAEEPVQSIWPSPIAATAAVTKAVVAKVVLLVPALWVDEVSVEASCITPLEFTISVPATSKPFLTLKL
jgi:hypothetical protein